MKKIIIIMLLLAVSVFAQQNMTGNITQPVNGSFTLIGTPGCIIQDRQLLFGPTVSDGSFLQSDCVRSDFFEVNGILSCSDGFCNVTTTLYDEAIEAFVATSKENDLMINAFDVLDESTDCLVGVYNGSIVNASPEMPINVGSKLYFNTVKPCFVRTIAALGMLEQIFIDEENASFLVQKFQELEVDYQHYLTREDLKASSSFSVPHATLTGTVEGAGGQQQQLIGQNDLVITVTGIQGSAPTYNINLKDAYNNYLELPAIFTFTVYASYMQSVLTPIVSGFPTGRVDELDRYSTTTTDGNQMVTIIFRVNPGTMPIAGTIASSSATTTNEVIIASFQGQQGERLLNDNIASGTDGNYPNPVITPNIEDIGNGGTGSDKVSLDNAFINANGQVNILFRQDNAGSNPGLGFSCISEDNSASTATPNPEDGITSQVQVTASLDGINAVTCWVFPRAYENTVADEIDISTIGLTQPDLTGTAGIIIGGPDDQVINNQGTLGITQQPDGQPSSDIKLTDITKSSGGVSWYVDSAIVPDELKPSYSIDFSWTEGATCIPPTVPSDCTLGIGPVTVTAAGLAAGVSICNYVANCEGTTSADGPFTFSVSPSYPDYAFYINIITPDNNNVNNFEGGLGSGPVGQVPAPWTPDPIVGNTNIFFQPQLCGLAGGVFTFATMVDTSPNDVSLGTLTIGPVGDFLAAEIIGSGSATVPAPTVLTIGPGIYDAVFAFANGQFFANNNFLVTWTASDTQLAGKGTITGQGIADRDNQDSMVALDTTGSFVPTGMTGAFGIGNIEGSSSTIVLLAAALIVVSVFLFILKRRQPQ